MSVNLVEVLKSQLGSSLSEQFGRFLGVDPGVARKGVDSLIPVVLGGILQKASNPAGLDELTQKMDSPELRGGSLLEKLPSLLSGGSSEQLANLGNGVLQSIFGKQLAGLMPTLGKAIGLDSGKISSLLGMIAPMVMSFLSKQKSEMNLDRTGFANLLSEQRKHVEKSLPEGLGELLNAADSLRTAAASASSAAASARSEGGSSLKYLVPLAAVLAIAFLGYRWYSGRGETSPNSEVTSQKPILEETSSDLVETLANLELPKLDLPAEAGQLAELTGKLNSSLLKITDAQVAESAVQELTDLNKQLDDFSASRETWSDTLSGQIRTQVGALVDPLQKMIDRLLEIPGVRPILEPILEKTIAIFRSLAGT